LIPGVPFVNRETTTAPPTNVQSTPSQAQSPLTGLFALSSGSYYVVGIVVIFLIGIFFFIIKKKGGEKV